MTQHNSSINILKKLVSFDTTTRQSNLELIKYIQDYLMGFGIVSHLIYSQDQTKANLVATIGENKCPGIVLSGHTDVVPAEPDGWVTSPWELTERNGNLYGRGACDMKGFLAVCLAHVPDFIAAKSNTPVHLCFSYDEEIGCIGVHSLVKYLNHLNYVPKIAIIGEPTMMNIIRGHKGKILVKCTVRGSAGHSSFAPQHVNAIEYSARAIAIIADKASEIERNGPFNENYSVPHTTMQTAIIKGGVASNITSDICVFSFEIRNIPEQKVENIFNDVRVYIENLFSDEMKTKSPDAGFTWETEFTYPGMCIDESCESYKAIKSMHPKIGDYVSYGTEGGIFQKEGNIPSIICGPGNIKQAHKRNEFLAIDQLNQCDDFMKKLVKTIQ